MKGRGNRIEELRRRLDRLEAQEKRESDLRKFDEWRETLPRIAKSGEFAAKRDDYLQSLKNGTPRYYPSGMMPPIKSVARHLWTLSGVAFEWGDVYASFLLGCAAMLADASEHTKPSDVRTFKGTFWGAIRGTKYAKHGNAFAVIGNAIADKEDYALTQILSGTDLAARWSIHAAPLFPNDYHLSVHYDDIVPRASAQFLTEDEA